MPQPDPETTPDTDDICTHCGAVMDLQRALAEDGATVPRRKRRPPAA